MQTVCVQDEDFDTVADLIRARNEIDARIAAITGRPMTAGHLGEWIAAKIFDIGLERSATSAAFDGRFSSGTLQGRTVNVKWYPKREGLLDVTESDALDYYLVLTGPATPATHSRGAVRPWTLTSVYLFDARQLLGELRARGVKIGTASSLLGAQWAAAEIFPEQRNPTLLVQPEQAAFLRRFRAEQ
jgi:hypothetical protein